MLGDIYCLIREFAGTSLTSSVLAQIEIWRDVLEARKYVTMGEYLFRVKEICRCDNKCGGLFCDPLQVLQLVGLRGKIDPTIEQNGVFL